MLQRLTLIRHAKALPGTLAEPDALRALAPQGVKEAYGLGTQLRRQAFTADVILCSTATRTRETLTHMTGGYEKPIAPVHYISRLYQASAEEVLEEAVLAGVEHVVIIGHNPSMVELVSRLAGEQTVKGFQLGHFATCSLASFACLGGGRYVFDTFIPRARASV